MIDLTDTTNNVDALEGARDAADRSALDPKPFAYSGVRMYVHVNFEKQNQQIKNGT